MKEILAKYGFSGIVLVLSVTLLAIALSSGQNSYVILGAFTLLFCSILITLNNAGIIPVKMTAILAVIIILGSLGFGYLDYMSIESKLEFNKEQKRREVKVIARLIDIRSAELSYKKLYGAYTGNFDELIRHVKNDSMPVVKAIGTVPDTLTELKAVELGIVTRDTILISVRDTLFPRDYPIDSLAYVPFSNGEKFDLEAGEVDKNNLKVKVFQAFAGYDKILHGLNLSEDYVDVSKGLSVGSMDEPHTRGNWE